MEALRATEPADGDALVFVGFMGAGKSSAARTVAAELGVQPLDSDRELERELGEPLESFFDREGEAAFRAREQELVLRLLARPVSPVLALGGGAVGSEAVREALGRHTVVHLEVEPDAAWRRASGKGRPLARERDRFDQLHRDRRALYEGVADAVLPPAERDTPRRALPALLALREAPAGTRLVWASAASGDYPVFLGRGLIASGFFYPGDGRRFAVTDEHVDRHHRVGCESRIVVLAGEEHKSIHSAELVLRQLAQADAERGDLVVAVGGGVVGDLGGFCAAVYQRGMRHVQVPTTVVAQVDSAYGGKTGVDLPEGKNYVGAYHQPAAVLCDPATLDTLPEEEASAGYAEVREERPDRRREPVGARAPGRSCGRPGRPGLRADEARRGGRGRAGRRAPPGPEPGAHRGPCHRGGDRIRALQARRGRGHRAAGGASPVGPRGPPPRGGGAARGARTAALLRRRRRG